MSRVGIRPIKIEEGIKVEKSDNKIIVSSGSLKKEIDILPGIEVKISSDTVQVSRTREDKQTASYHGLIARLISNAISDIKNGVKIEMEIVGTGYRAKVEGNKLILTMGYSHDVDKVIPEGMKVEVKKNDITIEGNDRRGVGEFAANVRGVRPPEVYKGKGIKYKEEIIKKKIQKIVLLNPVIDYQGTFTDAILDWGKEIFSEKNILEIMKVGKSKIVDDFIASKDFYIELSVL